MGGNFFSNVGNAIGSGVQQVGSWLSGSPTEQAVQKNQQYIKDPNQANYQIPGLAGYQQQFENAGQQGLNYAQEQQGQLANDTTGSMYANMGYQNQVNAQNGVFQANASGLGNYNNTMAGQGSQQQQQAFNAITNMANGNGPSLAGKNLQAGLNSENAAIQSQAMSNAGNTGLGNTERNLLNAQTANANNFAQAGGQASVAEQMGALQQEGGQAAAIRGANLQQAGASSAAGVAQRGQNLQSQQGANTADLGSQQLFTSAQLANAQTGITANQNAQGANAADIGSAFAGSVAQGQSNQAFDAAQSASGAQRANIGLQGTASGAAATAGAVKGIGKALQIGALAASDENMKTDIDQSDKTKSSLMSMLKSLSSSSGGASQGSSPSDRVANLGAGGAALGGGILSMGGYKAVDPSTGILGSDSSGKGAGAGAGGGGGIGALFQKLGSGGGADAGAGAAGADAAGAEAGAGAAGAGAGGAAGGLGFLAMLSDAREKVSQPAAPAALGEFMGKLKPSSYRYKDTSEPGTTPGRTHGIMAQDLEKSEVGKEMVVEHAGRKMVSIPKAVSTSLASLAFLNERISKLEQKRAS